MSATCPLLEIFQLTFSVPSIVGGNDKGTTEKPAEHPAYPAGHSASPFKGLFLKEISGIFAYSKRRK